MTNLLEKLKKVVGKKGYWEGEDINPSSYEDALKERAVRPLIFLRPANTEEVSEILKLCYEAGQPIVPQGGMTGLSAAAAPFQGEISLSLERMNKILEFDPLTATMTVEAGIPLQKVQELAAEKGFLFPLDLGARGSCTIGGNISTNAGGTRVIRYGMMRDLILGMEAVLADGTIIESLNKLTKNNTGYDLKQLFVGAEGTLGIVTKAVLKVTTRNQYQQVAFCGLKDFESVTELLTLMRQKLGSDLSAFEVIWENTYKLIEKYAKSVKIPLKEYHPFNVLIESSGTQSSEDNQQLVEALEVALEQGLLQDAVIARSTAEVRDLWHFRDSVSELVPGAIPAHSYDVSIAVGDMGYFGKEVMDRLTGRWPESTLAFFGHIGDGNIHILVYIGSDNIAMHGEISEIIYGLTSELQGSVSAEHGIGITKREYLNYSRTPEEITLMKTLKQAIDPKGILSPGRIFST
ncbi:MAG: FAD-binding oxidoreductase [Proteobacteria bacterium]|nr:FAD-binding oxidoreductase [Pseudomonadota bacterium]